MLQNYSKSASIEIEANDVKPRTNHRNWWMILVLPSLVFVGFFTAELIVTYAVILLKYLGISFSSTNESILNTIYSAAIYVIAIAITAGLPWLIKKHKTSREELGLARLPSWMDIIITPAGLIIYLLLSSALSLALAKFFPGIDLQQAQNVGFSEMSQKYEYILAFITLVIVAPVAEEILFRGYLFGKLKKYNIPIWLAMVVTSALFGAIHGQWDLAIDTFALSMVMCSLRQITGSLWPPILLHMTKNGIAYYILFINPIFLTTLGK